MTDTFDPRATYSAPPDTDDCDPKPKPRPDPCPPCDPPPVCELDCLVRPEFHCGQELTDDDLNALVRWTDRRLARVRYRDGWGVVCGLDLCIGRDCPTRVHVSPGYAIDCCGNDLVLCEPACIDLRPCCPDPCPPAGQDRTAARLAEARFAREMAARLGIGDLPFRIRKCVGVDICLEYETCASVSVPKPGCGCDCGGAQGDCGCGRGSDASLDPCAVTRRREGARLILCKARETPAAHDRFADAWAKALDIGAEIERRMKGYEDDARAFRKLLHELHLCSLGIVDRLFEAVAALGDRSTFRELVRRIDLQTLLFWLVYDRRLRLGARACHDCAEDDKLCLGRAWLFAGLDRRDRPVCFIAWLDTAEPVRRRLRPPRLPAPPGHVNLAPHLGQDPDVAALDLADRGLQVVGLEDLQLAPLKAAQVREIVGTGPFAAWGRRLVLIQAETGHGRRVVGWRFASRRHGSQGVRVREDETGYRDRTGYEDDTGDGDEDRYEDRTGYEDDTGDGDEDRYEDRTGYEDDTGGGDEDRYRDRTGYEDETGDGGETGYRDRTGYEEDAGYAEETGYGDADGDRPEPEYGEGDNRQAYGVDRDPDRPTGYAIEPGRDAYGEAPREASLEATPRPTQTEATPETPDDLDGGTDRPFDWGMSTFPARETESRAAGTTEDTPAAPKPHARTEPQDLRPVEDIHGIGEARGASLRKHGIQTVQDFHRADPVRLERIVKSWRTPGGKSPEELLSELREAAATLIEGDGDT